MTDAPEHISEQRLVACFGKEQYDSLPLAQRVAKRRNRGHRNVSPYKCWHCGSWHLGTRLKYRPKHRRD